MFCRSLFVLLYFLTLTIVLSVLLYFLTLTIVLSVLLYFLTLAIVLFVLLYFLTLAIVLSVLLYFLTLAILLSVLFDFRILITRFVSSKFSYILVDVLPSHNIYNKNFKDTNGWLISRKWKDKQYNCQKMKDKNK